MRKTLILSVSILAFVIISCATIASGSRDSAEEQGKQAEAAATVQPSVTPETVIKPLPAASATAVARKMTDSEKYYPLSVGNELYFKGYKKDSPDDVLKVKGEVKGIENKDGENFYYMYAPKMDIRYLLKRDENGVYMRMIKYPFLFFGSIEVSINPPLCFFKFPAKVGEKWESNAKAEASFMFIPISRDVKGKFEIVKKETIKTAAGDIDAYLVHARVNQGGDEKDVKLEKYWYGKGIGYTRADTLVHFADLVGYKIMDEETGKWVENLPENPDEYK